MSGSATSGLMLLLACGFCAVVALLSFGARSLQRTWRQRRGARRRLVDAAGAELRARAMMTELCPHGWRAQITLFEPRDELPEGAPAGERARVALDWAELGDGHDDIAVMRRVWGSTIVDALDAMVADRRTDETLEQIERSAGRWPDPQ